MRIKSPPLILDNTVISNYGLIKRFDILHSLYSKQIIVPTNVISEAIIIPEVEKSLKDAIDNRWIEEYTLDFVSGQAELKEYAKIRRRFGEGESAVMAIAKTWNCAIASDDLTATREYCKGNKIEHIGSLGILYDAFESGISSFTDCDKMLGDMINIANYKCPVTTFKQVEDWFKNGVGRKLY